jgi:hypothetical protein
VTRRRGVVLPTALRSPISGLMTRKPAARPWHGPTIPGRSNIQFWTFDRS